jgi:hypothetical protein
MKSMTILLSCVFFTVGSLSAQGYKNDLLAGIAFVHYPSPNASALSFYGEFSRPFLPNTIIGISAVASLPAEYETSIEKRELSAYHFSMNLYFSAVDTRQQSFKIGAGFAGGSFKTDWEVTGSGLKGTDNPFQPGFVALLEYNLIFDRRFILGVAGRGYIYGDEYSVLFGGIHAGYRF